jgi:predicted nucleic-acid-binding protein
MIGIDTNVLLRVFVEDQPSAHGTEARRLLLNAGRNGIRICEVVLIETIWTMRRAFGFGRAAIADFVIELLDRPEFVIENRANVETALEMFLGVQRVDFPDCLIAAGNESAGCERTHTFDADATALHQFAWLGTKD